VLEEAVKTVVLAPLPVPKSEDLDSSPVAKLNAIVYHKLINAQPYKLVRGKGKQVVRGT
jgi:hypothetical protein